MVDHHTGSLASVHGHGFVILGNDLYRKDHIHDLRRRPIGRIFHHGSDQGIGDLGIGARFVQPLLSLGRTDGFGGGLQQLARSRLIDLSDQRQTDRPLGERRIAELLVQALGLVVVIVHRQHRQVLGFCQIEALLLIRIQSAGLVIIRD